MEVTALNIFPIKSLGAVSVNQIEAFHLGFEHDRRWMLVDDMGEFLTQRSMASMAKFKCRLTDDSILVSYEGDQIEVPFKLYTDTPSRVKVWSSKLKANEVSSAISDWFSDALGISARLVKMTDISKRPRRLFVPPFKAELSFADGYPYLILGDASMATLNDKLQDKVNSNRFRANILISTSEAHEEDNWKSRFTMGTSVFKVIKPCARCGVVNINQEDGIKSKEPLKTLTEYRLRRKKIWFGANAICLEPGQVSVGDNIKFT